MFKSRHRRHILVEFVVGCLLCFRLSTIIVLLKNQHFKIPIQLGMDDEEPLSAFPTSKTLFTIYYYYDAPPSSLQ